MHFQGMTYFIADLNAALFVLSLLYMKYISI